VIREPRGRCQNSARPCGESCPTHDARRPGRSSHRRAASPGAGAAEGTLSRRYSDAFLLGWQAVLSRCRARPADVAAVARGGRAPRRASCRSPSAGARGLGGTRRAPARDGFVERARLPARARARTDGFLGIALRRPSTSSVFPRRDSRSAACCGLAGPSRLSPLPRPADAPAGAAPRCPSAWARPPRRARRGTATSDRRRRRRW